MVSRLLPPLVVVLSSKTAEHVQTLVGAGWSGPVLVVGSVGEAQQVIGAAPGWSRGPEQQVPGAAPERSREVAVATTSPAAARPELIPGAGRPASAHRSGRPHSAEPSGREPAGLRLDVDRRRVVHGAAARGLTPLEFGVLEALLRTPGRIHRYAELTRAVWGTTYTGDTASLHAVVRRLRRKLLEVSAPVELEAVRGIGFRLARADPAPVDALAEGSRVATGG